MIRNAYDDESGWIKIYEYSNYQIIPNQFLNLKIIKF